MRQLFKKYETTFLWTDFNKKDKQPKSVRTKQGEAETTKGEQNDNAWSHRMDYSLFNADDVLKLPKSPKYGLFQNISEEKVIFKEN